MNNRPNRQRFLPPKVYGSWHWGRFLVFCALLIFSGWLFGFFMPVWVAAIIGAVIGLVAGLFHWFEDEVSQPRRP